MTDANSNTNAADNKLVTAELYRYGWGRNNIADEHRDAEKKRKAAVDTMRKLAKAADLLKTIGHDIDDDPTPDGMDHNESMKVARAIDNLRSTLGDMENRCAGTAPVVVKRIDRKVRCRVWRKRGTYGRGAEIKAAVLAIVGDRALVSWNESNKHGKADRYFVEVPALYDVSSYDADDAKYELSVSVTDKDCAAWIETEWTYRAKSTRRLPDVWLHAVPTRTKKSIADLRAASDNN